MSGIQETLLSDMFILGFVQLQCTLQELWGPVL